MNLYFFAPTVYSYQIKNTSLNKKWSRRSRERRSRRRRRTRRIRRRQLIIV